MSERRQKSTKIDKKDKNPPAGRQKRDFCRFVLNVAISKFNSFFIYILDIYATKTVCFGRGPEILSTKSTKIQKGIRIFVFFVYCRQG